MVVSISSESHGHMGSQDKYEAKEVTVFYNFNFYHTLGVNHMVLAAMTLYQLGSDSILTNPVVVLELPIFSSFPTSPMFNCFEFISELRGSAWYLFLLHIFSGNPWLISKCIGSNIFTFSRVF